MTILYSAMNKASILSIVGRYVSLRATGREYKGLCPFHAEKTPSFTVNEEKGLFHCFGCGVGGDVIRFIELIENVSFKEALSILGIVDEPKPRPVVTVAHRQAAELAAAWMADQRHKINVLLGDVLEKIELADAIGDTELAESLLREQSLLHDLYEDLDISRNAADLLSIRPMIEALTRDVETPETHFEFPILTTEYRARLDALARGDS